MGTSVPHMRVKRISRSDGKDSPKNNRKTGRMLYNHGVSFSNRMDEPMFKFPLTLTDVISLILWGFVVVAITIILKLKRRGWLTRLISSLILVPLPYLLYMRFVKHFDVFRIRFSAESFTGTTGTILFWAVIGFVVYSLYLFLWPD